MIPFNDSRLLYRATRDGFSASAFHQNCDGFMNTISIIKTDSNFVLGGFASVVWNYTYNSELRVWKTDYHSFLFSLRRNGVSNNEKFALNINSWYADSAIYAGAGLAYGGGHDLFISDRSNVSFGSYSRLGYTYVSPSDCQSAYCSYLVGVNNTKWLTTEIEVFQISSPNLTFTTFSTNNQFQSTPYNQGQTTQNIAVENS